ncbi:hypothetical protein E4U43_008032 [Claviceps pusilla]|uniref:Uncharacterized protein n=1 Tax=Claviceps pusilla TaxID=123648 RepID=A0A9P7NBF1_9HYPO|nr:hypothetical protein E4U43_008032 [Claviceps pusilla]
MGPPRTRAHLVAQRGRFQEGSMNDRASAAPPLQFLDPSERAALEKPVFWESQTGRCFARRPQAETLDLIGREAPWTASAAAAGGEDKRSSKMGFLGQMWEGVRGKLRLRRDDEKEKASFRDYYHDDDDGDGDGDDDNDETRYGLRNGRDRGPQRGSEQRPSREQVLASYHQLVASGFFSSHAIQSTRFGPPRPKTSHGHDGATPPQWPLTPAIPAASQAMAAPSTPIQTCRSSEVCSPVSGASSRGTKRAAADSPSVRAKEAAGDDNQDGDAKDEPDHENGTRNHDNHKHDDDGDDHDDDEAEDDATLAHRFLPKRLRQTASRDISLPKIRSAASRKHLRSAVAAARKGLSTSAAVATRARYAANDGDVDMDALPDNHARRPDGDGPFRNTPRGEAHAASSPGCAPSSPSSPSCRKIKRPARARSLKANGAAEGNGAPVSVPAMPVFGPAHVGTLPPPPPLRVVPDANRGIPNVPVIPVKFTYGEDRENGSPWRGLRRG